MSGIKNNFAMITLAQIFGPLSLWASLPSFLLYYLFYSTFEHNDPEGPVKDTKVRTCLWCFMFIFAFLRARYRFIRHGYYIKQNPAAAATRPKKNWLFSFEFQSKKIPLIFAIDLLLFFFTSQGWDLILSKIFGSLPAALDQGREDKKKIWCVHLQVLQLNIQPHSSSRIRFFSFLYLTHLPVGKAFM